MGRRLPAHARSVDGTERVLDLESERLQPEPQCWTGRPGESNRLVPRRRLRRLDGCRRLQLRQRKLFEGLWRDLQAVPGTRTGQADNPSRVGCLEPGGAEG